MKRNSRQKKIQSLAQFLGRHNIFLVGFVESEVPWGTGKTVWLLYKKLQLPNSPEQKALALLGGLAIKHLNGCIAQHTTSNLVVAWFNWLSTLRW